MDNLCFDKRFVVTYFNNCILMRNVILKFFLNTGLGLGLEENWPWPQRELALALASKRTGLGLGLEDYWHWPWPRRLLALALASNMLSSNPSLPATSVQSLEKAWSRIWNPLLSLARIKLDNPKLQLLANYRRRQQGHVTTF